jgi:hypothetical protein
MLLCDLCKLFSVVNCINDGKRTSKKYFGTLVESLFDTTLTQRSANLSDDEATEY